MDEPPPRPRRRRFAALVLLVVASNAAWLVGTRLNGGGRARDVEPPAPALLTATVERRALTSSVIARGDAAPREAVAVSAPSSVEGPPVVSSITVEPGDAVAEGERPIEVSGRPVFVLAGTVPAYRTMRPGQSGADVSQLQAALARLGYPSDGGGAYGSLTKEGVAALYRAHGYDAPTASADEGAELATAAREVEVATAGVHAAERALARTLAGPTDEERQAADAAVAAAGRAEQLAAVQRDADVQGAQLDAAAAADRARRLAADPAADPDDRRAADLEAAHATSNVAVVQARGDAAVADAADQRALAEGARAQLDQPRDATEELAALAQARTSRDSAVAARDAVVRSTGPVVPQGEVVFVPTVPARVDRITTPSVAGGPGRAGGEAGADASGSSGGPLLVLAAGGVQVAAPVPPDEAGRLRPGTEAELLDESTGELRAATVASVDPVTAGEQGATQLVHLVGEGLPDRWSGTNLRVTFRRATTSGPVLVVPVSAVSSAADGGARVRVLTSRDGPRTVPVEVGGSADGYVEVRPVRGAVRAGDRVVVGR